MTDWKGASSSSSSSSSSVMPTLAQIVAEQDWKAMYDICLARELEEVTERADFFFELQMLACFLLNDLKGARFLWKRLSPKMKEHKEMSALWEIGKALWQRDYKALKAAFGGLTWSTEIAPLITALTKQTRQQTMSLISRGYSSISLECCSEMLGVDPKEATKMCKQRGWEIDGNTIIPLVVPSPKQQEVSVSELDQLTEYILKLEQ
eukprot:gb/GEZN01012704.1/.p1 GENE.gb/GEZN01012704.1/~~gb/GEZN01012704.1/.p1  ORF type:complete len:222 (-),score=55.70 gb/GEZN01012704.1/:395-1015(-)